MTSIIHLIGGYARLTAFDLENRCSGADGSLTLCAFFGRSCDDLLPPLGASENMKIDDDIVHAGNSGLPSPKSRYQILTASG